jgi:hypothetical protein
MGPMRAPLTHSRRPAMAIGFARHALRAEFSGETPRGFAVSTDQWTGLKQPHSNRPVLQSVKQFYVTGPSRANPAG